MPVPAASSCWYPSVVSMSTRPGSTFFAMAETSLGPDEPEEPEPDEPDEPDDRMSRSPKSQSPTSRTARGARTEPDGSAQECEAGLD